MGAKERFGGVSRRCQRPLCMIYGERVEEKVPWLERSVIDGVLNLTSLNEVSRKIAQARVEVQ